MRKLIEFDDDSFAKLTQLGRDRMATLQDLVDEAMADLLKKHGVPLDLRDALRRSARGEPDRPRATSARAASATKHPAKHPV
jgi:hypothetical protein